MGVHTDVPTLLDPIDVLVIMVTPYLLTHGDVKVRLYSEYACS